MTRSRCAWLALSLVSIAALLALAGCTLIGVMAASYEDTADHEVTAEYRGLEGKNFAVIVTADRLIQSSHPRLVEYLTNKTTERLAGLKNVPHPAGFVKPADVLKYLYDHPGWNSKPMSEIAKGLGVERLVFIELFEFQLHDPGNQYEWSGLASGNVAIVEADSNVPDEFGFERSISAKFPDKGGMGPQDISTDMMLTALAPRFADRAAWLMYDHREANRITY